MSAFLSNEGAQPIPLAAHDRRHHGRRQAAAAARVPSAVTTVAPRQKAPVFQMPDQVWREGTQSWSMEIVLRTAKGETYRNTLTWK